jgi:hypothetical protein
MRTGGVVRSTAATQPVTSGAATTVRTASKGAATTARGAAKRAGTTARSAAERAGTTARTAAERAGSKPAFRAARERLGAAVTTAASYTASKVGQIGLTAAPTGPRGEAATTAPGATLGAVAAALTFIRPAVAHRAGSPAATAPTADGTARLEPVAGSGRDAALGAPASQPTGLTSGAASSAAAATAALVGLLGILVFASQRRGTLVRLRPASAPMPPFLALPERPG